MFNFNDENDKIQFANRLIASREKKDLTQEKLAELLHVSRSTIAMWENAKNIPHYVNLSDICRVLDIDMGYLMGDYTEKNYTINQISKCTKLNESAIENIIKLDQEYCNTLSMLLNDIDFLYRLLPEIHRLKDNYDYLKANKFSKDYDKWNIARSVCFYAEMGIDEAISNLKNKIASDRKALYYGV